MKNNNAFTLLELILVTMIISILAFVSSISIRKQQLALEDKKLFDTAQSVFRLSENALAIENYKFNVVDDGEIDFMDADFIPDYEKEFYKDLTIKVYIDDGRVIKVTCENEDEHERSFPEDKEEKE